MRTARVEQGDGQGHAQVVAGDRAVAPAREHLPDRGHGHLQRVRAEHMAGEGNPLDAAIGEEGRQVA